MKKIIKKIKLKNVRKKISNNVTLKGKHYSFCETSTIVLQDGSDKNDVIFEDHIRMNGCLISQNHAKIICGNHVTIGRNTKIYAVNSVILEDFATIAYDVTIMDNNNHPINPEERKIIYSNPSLNFPLRSLWKISDSAPILIQRNAWVGANAIILKGVTIGENSIVGIGAVVTKNVPKNCIVAGNPAKIVKKDIHKLPSSPLFEKELSKFH